MPSLRELQRSFATAIMDADAAALGDLGIVDNGLDPAARIAIYRNNVFGNYRKTLAATFPVIKRLVGEPFFSLAVDAFVRAHPSMRCDVNRYGGELSLFLADYPTARVLDYLPDVARLEWAVDQANIAADAAPLDVAALGAVPAEMFAELRFVLHPSAQLLQSRYPIFRIWRVNQPDYVGSDVVDLGEGGDALLVFRSDDGVLVERLSAGERVMLAAIAAKRAFGSVAERASEAEPGFDLSDALRRYVQSRAIVAFRTPIVTRTENHP